MTDELPDGWAPAILADLILEIETGKSFRSEPRPAASEEWGVIKVSAMTWGRFRADENKTIPAGVEVDPRWVIKVGDLLLSRANTEEYVGATVLVDQTPGNLLLSDKSMRLVPARDIDRRWLLYWLRAPQSRGQLSGLATGTKHSMRNISQDKVRSLRLSVPPSGEQRRIVAAVDKQLSRLDGAVRLLRSSLARLPLVRRAVLGSVMPEPLPDGWKLLTIEESGTVELGRQRSPQYHSGPNMKPYLRVANVHEDRIDLSDVKWMDFPPEQLPRYELRAGDILLNEGQSPEFVGRPAMYRGELPGVCFTNSLIRFRPFDFVDGEYALLVFLRHLRFGRFQREAQITTNIAHMAAGRFKKVEFPLPPLDEQRAIVQETRRDLSLLSVFESELKTSLRRADTLRAAILAAAFRGELVRQDSADEPATELLARITADRSAPASGHKKNGA